jgi:hypothetical protein
MHTKTAIAVCLALCCGLLQGCVVIPVPVPRSSGPTKSSRVEVSNTLPEQIIAGQTTRAQVLLLLGEPDGRGDLDRWFTYGSRVGRGGVGWALFIAAGLGYGGGAAGVAKLGDWNTSRRVIIHFDGAGLVSDVDFAEKNCTEDNRNCLDAGGREIIAAEAAQSARVEHAAQLAAAGPVLARYASFVWIDYGYPQCSGLRLGKSRLSVGNELLIAEHAILGTGQGPDSNTGALKPHYSIVTYDQIEEVRPIERHLFHPWIPLRTRAGSCVYIRLAPRTGELSPDEARALIVAHLAAGPTAANASK